jgi:hypothetical protein
MTEGFGERAGSDVQLHILCGGVAQLGERIVRIDEVVGSIPILSTNDSPKAPSPTRRGFFIGRLRPVQRRAGAPSPRSPPRGGFAEVFQRPGMRQRVRMARSVAVVPIVLRPMQAPILAQDKYIYPLVDSPLVLVCVYPSGQSLVIAPISVPAPPD